MGGYFAFSSGSVDKGPAVIKPDWLAQPVRDTTASPVTELGHFRGSQGSGWDLEQVHKF